jgi:hypothetical protein
MIDLSAVWITGVVVVALMGVYLTYVGWRPMTTDLHGDQLHIDIEFPRAA